MNLRRSPLSLILLLCLTTYGYSQAWNGVLSSKRAIDWSQAGVAGGIPTNRSQCVTSQCATVSGGSVTTSSVNAALASAPANSYVLIPAGTFTISGGIWFGNKSNVTLRGSGSNSTFLVFTGGNSHCGGGNHDICADGSDMNYWQSPSNSATWSGTNGSSGTYTQGATSIILSSKTNLAVGAPLILDQVDDQSDSGGLYVGCEVNDGSPACDSIDGPSGYQRGSSLSNIRGQQQIVNVTSISGSGPYTVGITPGIYASNWQSSHSPGAWWASSPIYGDAVEDISLDHSNGGDGITWFNCSGCWVKGIRSVRTTSTGTGWYHVSHLICNHCTVRDSYFYGFDGDSYELPAFIASDLLLENNILQRPGAIVFNSDCEGCVQGYNFEVNDVSGTTPSNWFSQSQYMHSIDLFTLQEGNIGAGVYEDQFHGTHVLNTYFRNRFDGREEDNGQATGSSTTPFVLSPGARYSNIIGNVLGTAGYHTNYIATPSNGKNTDVSIYNAGVGQTNDGQVAPTTMFWGNWDPVTNAVRWCGSSSDTGWSSTCGSASEVPSTLSAYANAVPAAESLPASFYYSSRPSWLSSSKPWPLIGPDVTGGNVGQCVGGTYNSSQCTSNSQCSAGGGSCSLVGAGRVVSNPAMDCYLTTMGGVANGTGNALSFDASSCYSSSGGSGGGGGTPPAPPSSLSAVVQ